MKTMKIMVLLAVLVTLVTVLPAHPASKVDVSFDKATKLLKVTFVHKVRDEADHYIKDVTIQVNGREVVAQKPIMQDTVNGGELIYKVNDVKGGDKISVTTECNKGGKKAATLEVK